MKICLIAEGSYPYVMGGVASWIQMLITSMPEHEFVIYTIAAETSQKGKYKYKIPQNVSRIYENFLDEYENSDGQWGKKYRLTDEEKSAFRDLIGGKPFDWNLIIRLIRSDRYDNIVNFLMSSELFQIIQDSSEKYYPQIPFTEYYWSVRSMLLPLLQILKTEIPQADIYHSVSTGYAGIIGGLAKYSYHKPFILTEHGIYSREREEEIIKASWLKDYFKKMWIEYFYNMARYAYDSADKVIALFNKNREIEIELGCDPTKTAIIPNGINVSSFETKHEAEDDEEYIQIGAYVRIVPIKDIITMINAFNFAKAYNDKLKLYIMGPTDENPDYYKECQKAVERLELKDVVFTGMVDTVKTIGNMDIILLTSISEGQPFTLLEAMAAKKPTIATDVGSCRELLEGFNDPFGAAGITVPVMNYEKIGHALLKLAQNQDLRIQMGENGYRRVKESYTTEKFIQKYKTLYKKCGVK